MFSLYQTLAAIIRRLAKLMFGLTQHVSWSNYCCLDEEAVMWASTFGSHAWQRSTF